MALDYLVGFKLKKYMEKRFIIIFDTRTRLRLRFLSVPKIISVTVQIVTITESANPDKNQKLLSLFSKGYKNNNKADTII
jgi:hypothetical protein